jgi:hypothetical protein
MSKLTLSVDPEVISRAKRLAKRRGVSVSAMVEAYLAAVADTKTPASKDLPPVLRSIRGILKKADIEAYRAHLVDKYR